MKKLTIIVDDGLVSVDGESYTGIDLSEIAAENIHAVQFYGTWGEVEFKPFVHLDEDGVARLRKPENAVFGADGVSVFDREMQRWNDAKQAAAQAAAAVPVP